MGSAAVLVESKCEDPDRAYAELVASAREEYGYDPYSGTIAASSGFRVVDRVVRSRAAARVFAEGRLEHASKWEPLEAVRVGEPKSKPKVRKVKFRIVPEAGESTVGVSLERVAAELGVDVNDMLSFAVVSSKTKFAKVVSPGSKASRKWTTTAGGMFDTKRDALEFAAKRLEVLEQSALNRSSTFLQTDVRVGVSEVLVAERRHELARQLRSWDVTVEAQVVAPGSSLTPSGWLFYGMVPC